MCLFFKYTPYLSSMHILPLTFMSIVPPATPGSKTPFDERYNAFFIDYSLTPLLVQHNYIDSAKNGIFKNPGLDDVTRMQMLSRASDAVSDRCVCCEWCCVLRERAAPAAVSICNLLSQLWAL
jgi:hypothetical protein